MASKEVEKPDADEADAPAAKRAKKQKGDGDGHDVDDSARLRSLLQPDPGSEEFNVGCSKAQTLVQSFHDGKDYFDDMLPVLLETLHRVRGSPAAVLGVTRLVGTLLSYFIELYPETATAVRPFLTMAAALPEVRSRMVHALVLPAKGEEVEDSVPAEEWREPLEAAGLWVPLLETAGDTGGSLATLEAQEVVFHMLCEEDFRAAVRCVLRAVEALEQLVASGEGDGEVVVGVCARLICAALMHRDEEDEAGPSIAQVTAGVVLQNASLVARLVQVLDESTPKLQQKQEVGAATYAEESMPCSHPAGCAAFCVLLGALAQSPSGYADAAVVRTVVGAFVVHRHHAEARTGVCCEVLETWAKDFKSRVGAIWTDAGGDDVEFYM